MSHDQDDLSAAADMSAPTAADFDQAFSAAAASAGIRRVWELAAPDLPPQVEPFSFVSADLLRHVAQALHLSPGQTLVDLGCGRGGPGLWLAREADVSLVGVDFSPVAINQATHRAALFGLADRARFVVGDLTSTGLPDASADAAVSIDAFHFAADPAAAAAEARRVLRPDGRLVLTNWQPKIPDDARLPVRSRINWPQLLHSAGFADIAMEDRPEWHDLFTRVYQIALDLGDPRDDAVLADLQDEARQRLPVADLKHRVVVTAIAPDRPRAAPSGQGPGRSLPGPDAGHPLQPAGGDPQGRHPDHPGSCPDGTDSQADNGDLGVPAACPSSGKWPVVAVTHGLSASAPTWKSPARLRSRRSLPSSGSPGLVARQGTPVKAGAVRFFRKSPAPGPAPRRVHHPWNPPEAELPGIVATPPAEASSSGQKMTRAPPHRPGGIYTG